MASFEPIAIVGQGCVLPGALSPDALWQAVARGADLTTDATVDDWGIAPDLVRCEPGVNLPDRTWSIRGGRVHGLIPQVPSRLSAELEARLDPGLRWCVYAADQALRDAGLGPFETGRSDAGVILGNLSYAPRSMADMAAHHWLRQQRNGLSESLRKAAGYDTLDYGLRFSSSAPAAVTAKAMGFEGPSYCLDAACASSLYAIKLACDQLQDGRANLMLAGAINYADNLYLHIGFTALQAMSRSGVSKPFDQSADGLVPAEGAAMVVLKRLKDALADGDTIHGIIRGVGLSNDGREGGFLSPSSAGQVRAMADAYQQSGVSPHEVSYLECHATGTVAGDATELKSIRQWFSGHSGLPLASLKGNLGHLITAAGTAGLVRTLAAMKHGQLAPSIHVNQAIDGFENGPCRLVQSLERWQVSGPRIAGVNAFGFGGNNAHLLVQHEWHDTVWSVPKAVVQDDPVVIVGVAVQTGDAANTQAFTQRLFDTHDGQPTPLDQIAVDLKGLGVPPSDLDHTLGQQLLMMETVRTLVSESKGLNPQRTSVLVGMNTDVETTRFAMRARLEEWLNQGVGTLDSLISLKAGITDAITAAGVLGTMPNIPANRSNHQLDLQGPSYTVSADELSGVVGLHIAERALKRGEIDAAIVGAVDLCCESVHEAAKQVLGIHTPSADGAVALMLKRRRDAQAAGDIIFAQLEPSMPDAPVFSRGDLPRSLGDNHAASGLMTVASAALMLRYGYRRGTQRWIPDLRPTRAYRVSVDATQPWVGLNQTQTVTLSHSETPTPLHPTPSIYRYAADSIEALRDALQQGLTGYDGGYRLAIVAENDDDFALKRHRALAQLGAWQNMTEWHQKPLGQGMYFATGPLQGEVGFVFTGAASAYAGMGQDFCAAFPQTVADTLAAHPVLQACQSWLDADRDEPESPFEVLQGCSLLSQIHARFTQSALGIVPKAMLGVSSGETNSMFASGAWHDMGAMFEEIDAAEMYQTWISGDFKTVQKAWNDPHVTDWRAYRVVGPVDQLASLVADQPRAFLTMINTDNDGVLAGERSVMEALLPQVQSLAKAVIPLGHDIIAHCPVLSTWEAPWRQIHDRDTQVPENIRFYSNARGGRYDLSRESIADALTDQATAEVDFRPVVEAAYADGIRVFIEHGPRQLCSQWVSDILGDRSHVSVHLDRAGAGIMPVYEAAAQLWCAGVPLNFDVLDAPVPPVVEAPKTVRWYPAHPPAVVIKQGGRVVDSSASMPPAPTLPSVFKTVASNEDNLARVMAELALAPQPYYGTPVATPAIPMAQPATGNVFDTMRQLHAQLAATHQQYMAVQANAMQKLVAAQAYFGASGNQGVRNQGVRVVDFQSADLTPEIKDSDTLIPLTQADFPGPKYDRQQLEVLAGGKISEVFGPLFEQQDGYAQQVRMPCPPLLLADRVLGIDATPGAMETRGTIWTETDVTEQAWYVHHGHMPAGIMIESGQADLLLISWMGADFENKGERVYRLLGCELTYRDKLPAVGDTLRYDIHVDGYAKQGDVRLFFFHYNCQINGNTHLEVRHGQAGFFTYDELNHSSGVIWDAASESPRGDLGVVAGPQHTERSSFDQKAIQAFADGDLVACFGEGFEAAHCHQRTPTVAGGDLLMFDHVSELNHQGGPWQRGYLRAELNIRDDHWFFDGHFKNDPCMPGTLMFEGGVQVMAFYLASMGFTLARDGWRFEPVKNEAFKLLCRSQLIPGARQLVYEIFVHGVEGGDTPALRVDLMCSVDGRKAFLGQSVGIELVPGWPMESRGRLLPSSVSSDVAREQDFAFDERSMVACAWGKPSDAFGPHYAQFNGPRKGPRLPGYPYHFISRILSVSDAPRLMQSGARVSVEYDVPADAWYFAENGQTTMSFPVLLEAALQPCGWLATYMGGGFEGEQNLFFRNLDGTATQHREVLPNAGRLTTQVTNTSVSKVGAMTIVGFEVQTLQGGDVVYEMNTVFGFFPTESLAQQAGLPSSDEERAALAEQGQIIHLKHRPAEYFNGSLRLPGPMLTLIDRVTGYWPEGGSHQQGRVRTEMDVDPNAWFFKAHFYGDPVQPGSLGLEMMQQSLQYLALAQGVGEGFKCPRFESVAVGEAHGWSYRGQVLPYNDTVVCDVSVVSMVKAIGRVVLKANATLWVDGTKIYKADDISVAVVEEQSAIQQAADRVFDLAKDTWVNDHCPTCTVPSLPMVSLMELMVAATQARVPGKRIVGLSGVKAKCWLAFQQPIRRVRAWANPVSGRETEAQLAVWEDCRYQSVAEGTVMMAEQYSFAPKAWASLNDAVTVESPYACRDLFHGPAFQALVRLDMSDQGSTAWIDAAASTVPQGQLNQGLLDACLHGTPHHNLRHWFPTLADGLAAYPLVVQRVDFYGETPRAGLCRVEARPLGIHPQWQMPLLGIQIINPDEQVWAEMELIEAVMPKGPLGRVDAMQRDRFIRDQQYVAGVSLSDVHPEGSSLSEVQVKASNWLPGTLEAIYGVAPCDASRLTQDILVKEHLGGLLRQHPSRIVTHWQGDQVSAATADQLLVRYALQVQESDAGNYHVTHETLGVDITPVRDFWRQSLGKSSGIEEDLFLALCLRFTGAVKSVVPEVVTASHAQGVVFMANHQVGAESVLFSILLAGLRGQTVFAMGKKEHRESWIGKLLYAVFGDTGDSPKLMTLVDRENPQDVFDKISAAMGHLVNGDRSLLVHVGGTRAVKARQLVETVSTALIGAAVAAGVDIVPVTFRSGLPLAPVEKRLEFPVGYGKQDMVLGEPITCAELSALNTMEQKQRVLDALNGLDDILTTDTPCMPDTVFEQQVNAYVAEHGVEIHQAVLWLTLSQSPLPLSEESRRVVDVMTGQSRWRDDETDRWLKHITQTALGAN